jgi:hypothetical protein
MARFSASVVCLGILYLGVRPATADPILITSGHLIITGPVEVGSIAVRGTRGFTLQSAVAPNEGNVEAFTFCGDPGCEPGGTFSISGFLGGFAFPGGVATLDGITYDDISSLNSPAGPLLRLAGTAQLPDLEDFSGVITAPFNLTGFFRLPFPGEPVQLLGQGVASISITPSPLGPGFPFPRLLFVDDIRYDFGAPAPIPEPSTVLLVGAGVISVFGQRLRRRRG